MIEKVTLQLTGDSKLVPENGPDCGEMNPKTLLLYAAAKCSGMTALMIMEKERLRGRVTARITLAEFVDEVYWPQKAGLRANTRQGYERDLRRRILPALGNMELEQINKLNIQRMISGCPTRKTATNARETLSSVLGCAVEMGMIPVNPASFRYTYPGDGAADPERGGVWLTTFAEHMRLLGLLRETQPGSCVSASLRLAASAS